MRSTMPGFDALLFPDIIWFTTSPSESVFIDRLAVEKLPFVEHKTGAEPKLMSASHIEKSDYSPVKIKLLLMF